MMWPQAKESQDCREAPGAGGHREDPPRDPPLEPRGGTAPPAPGFQTLAPERGEEKLRKRIKSSRPSSHKVETAQTFADGLGSKGNVEYL